MLEKIQLWYVEAVALFGDDWPRIEQYVNAKLSDVGHTDRVRLLEEFRVMQPRQVRHTH
jgi:hypothetical protein